jgi:hypothetical protein
MKRCVLALAGLLALPVCAQAQTRPVYTPEAVPEQLPTSRLSVTPFVGARVPYNTGSFYVIGANGEQLLVEEQREGSYAVGLNADAAFRGPFRFIASVAYSGSRQDNFVFGAPGDSLPEGGFTTDGPTLWFAKVGLSARLPDPIPDERRFHPAAFVSVAPALVFVNHPSAGSSQHFALNIGADAVTRIGRGNFALNIGLEDYITFWNTDDFRERNVAQFADDPRFEGGAVNIDYDYSTANILMLRLGVSYRH